MSLILAQLNCFLTTYPRLAFLIHASSVMEIREPRILPVTSLGHYTERCRRIEEHHPRKALT